MYVVGETHELGAPVPVPDPYPVDSRTDVVPTASVELTWMGVEDAAGGMVNVASTADVFFAPSGDKDVPDEKAEV